MKIAQIVASLDTRHGGPSRSVLGVSAGLAGNGHSVDLLTTGPLGNVETRGEGRLSIRTFPRRQPLSLARSPLLREHLRSHPYEVIHHHGLWQRTLHYAHDITGRTGVPLVISPRGMMSPWAWRHRRWKKFIASLCVHRGAFAAAHGWHATCEAEADDIRRLGFHQPVCVAPNGVIAPEEAEESGEAAHWAGLLPGLAGRRVALFYSRFHSKKRVLELIDLWLSRPRGDWVLLVAGIPEQYSVNQIDAYLIRNGGLGRVVVQDGAGHPPPYKIASLFLLPSHSENFGLVVVEALVRGVPVLTTDATPWRELSIRDAGRCVPWDDFSRALDAMLIESPAALAAAGARARAWARSAFSWDKTAETLCTFYEGLTATR